MAWVGPWFWSWYAPAWDDHGEERRRRQIEPLVALLVDQGTPGEPVLDLGCGTGEWTLALADTGFRVVGADVAPGMLQRARSKLDQGPANASFRRVDFNQALPFGPGQFRHALCVSVLQCAADPTHVLRELARILQPGGLVVLASSDRARSAAPQARPARIRSRLLRLAKDLVERTGVVRDLTGEDQARLLEGAGFTVLDFHPPVAGLAVTVGRRRSAQSTAPPRR